MKVKNKFFESEGMRQLDELQKMKLPATQSYNVAKLIKEIEEKAKIYQDTKIKLLKHYGKSEDGVKYDIAKENQDKFQEEIEALWDMDIKLNAKKITLPADIEVSGQFLLALEDLVEIK